MKKRQKTNELLFGIKLYVKLVQTLMMTEMVALHLQCSTYHVAAIFICLVLMVSWVDWSI